MRKRKSEIPKYSSYALVTGAAGGMGRIYAEALAKRGYNLLLVDINRDGLAETDTLIRQTVKELYPDNAECGFETLVIVQDLSEQDAAEKIFAEAESHGCVVDVLVNNAGGALKMPQGGFDKMPVEYWDSQIRLNLSAAAYCSRIAMQDMIARGDGGKIINVSSVHGLVTYVRRKTLPYCAAKAGLIMFTKALGVEAIKYGINVNCIAPGFIMTKATTRYDQKEMDAFLRKIPAGRLGKVGDIVPLMLFLADDEKSSFIVGQTFTVDGGQSIDGAIDYMLDFEI